METPAIPAPKDDREKEILERLVAIRDSLLLLKQDRTKYIRSQDVMGLYEQTIEEVRNVNEVRSSSSEDARENRLDKVMESCFQLLSLFFMTIGRTNEAPAAYSLTSTIKRLLDHLTESHLFSAKDLDSMAKTLDQLSKTVNESDSRHSPYLVRLLSKRVGLCQSSLRNLQKQLEALDDTLLNVHEKLISILRSMSLANTKAKVRPLDHSGGCGPVTDTFIVQHVRGREASGPTERDRRPAPGWQVHDRRRPGRQGQRSGVRAPGGMSRVV